MPVIQPYRIVDIDAHPPLEAMHIDYFGTMDASIFFDRLSLAGIDAVCGTPMPPSDFFKHHKLQDAVCLLNGEAMKLAAVQRKYFPALFVHPDCAEASVSQIEKYAARGVRLLEINAAWTGHDGLERILECAQQLPMSVLLQGETPQQAAALAQRFPRLHLLVGGRLGKGYMPADAHCLMQAHPNVSLNLSGIIWSCNYVLHEWAARFGADRLFFGSGYPLCNPGGKATAVRWELRDEREEVKKLILSENACRLVGAEGRNAWK